MSVLTFTSLGGIALQPHLPPSVDLDPVTLNKVRLRVLATTTKDRVDIVHDESSLTAAFREFTPGPPGRFKYMVTELFDGSVQLRVSASNDELGCNWSCNHPDMFLSSQLMIHHSLSEIYSEKLVAAGFMMLRRNLMLIDGSSGHFPTDASSVQTMPNVSASKFAGLKTTAKLMKSILPEYVLTVRGLSSID